ncbi:hypothetical protein CPB97_011781 [Podila verticillata]|nr:hypothetical protein CPB97_011781 [Podila verticillata]
MIKLSLLLTTAATLTIAVKTDASFSVCIGFHLWNEAGDNGASYDTFENFCPTVRLEEVCTNRGGVIQFHCCNNTLGWCDANSAWQKQMCYNHIEMGSDSLTCKDT